MLRTLSTAALFALVSAAAQAAPLTPVVEVASVDVAYGDLNLTKPGDAAVLADRLQAAAHSVCLKTNDATPAIQKILMRRCMDLAVSKATSQIRADIESAPSRSIRANLMSVRQQVASAAMP